MSKEQSLEKNKEQSLENYLYWKNKSEEDTYCLNCGSRLGGDCGDAEPDFNEQFCSKGCYENKEKSDENV